MAYSIAADGGGTKTKLIVYDGDFNPVKRIRIGSVRHTSNSVDVIEGHLQKMLDELAFLQGEEIELISGTVSAKVPEYISKICKVKKTRHLCESELALGAAGVERGIVALSGTGCTIFYRDHERVKYAGGYGSIISDEGSGFYLSKLAFCAAIKAYEGRGPKTILTELIKERFGRSDFQRAVFDVYEQPGISPVQVVSSCSVLVDKAAKCGDEVAIGLIRECALAVVDQVTAFVRKEGLAEDSDVVISGGCWKGNPGYFKTFRDKMKEDLPLCRVVIPTLEPIAAPIVIHASEKLGVQISSALTRISGLYTEERFKMQEEQ